MVKAKSGDTVKIHYTGKFDDGSVFESSTGGDPLEFTIGSGQIMPGFEEAVVGMEPGQSKTATITAENAYGPHRPEMVFEVDHSKFPEKINPQLGDRFQIPQQDGHMLVVTVIRVTDAKVVLDANHPLAGKDLTFDILLVAIG